MIEIKFKEKRKEAKLTQKQVADILGVNQSTVHLWDVGKTAPRRALLSKVAELYGCTKDELLAEE